jgi:hypothetical protein
MGGAQFLQPQCVSVLHSIPQVRSWNERSIVIGSIHSQILRHTTREQINLLVERCFGLVEHRSKHSSYAFDEQCMPCCLVLFTGKPASGNIERVQCVVKAMAVRTLDQNINTIGSSKAQASTRSVTPVAKCM